MKHTFEIELSGKTYTCRATFAAIDAFEDRAGVGVTEAWEALADGKMKFSTIATAVWAAINGERIFNGEKPLIWGVVGQMVQDHGFLKCAVYASEFFAKTLPETESDEKPSDEAGQKKSS